jgi:hypothetical protein
MNGGGYGPPRRVGPRVAHAIAPEVDRRQVPATIAISGGDLPYQGELREEQFNASRVPIAPGTTVTLATLRRGWTFVGFGLDPGDLPAGGAPNVVNVFLFALVRGMRVRIGAIAVAGGLGPLGVGSVTAGVPCEVAIQVPIAVPLAVNNVRGAIWGYDVGPVPLPPQ